MHARSCRFVLDLLVSQCLKTNGEIQTPRHMAVLIWLHFKLVSYLLWKDELSQGLPARLCGRMLGKNDGTFVQATGI